MKRNTRALPETSRDERLVRVRVRLAHAPPRYFCDYVDIEGGIQIGKDVLPGEVDADGLMRFTAELRAGRDAATGEVIFLGPYTFGPRGERFLYVSWSHARDRKREMFRRMKVRLKDIAWEQVETAAAAPDRVLETTVPGIARDGGPACARVPLIGGWHVRDATPVAPC